MLIGILESNDFSEIALKQLKKIGEVYCFLPTEQTVEEFVKDKEVLFIRLNYFLDEQLLKNAVKLKVICSPTTGLNHIDTEYISRREIELISLKGDVDFLTTIRATPEHTFGLTLALLRNYNACFIREGKSVWDRERFKGYELFDATVGIIGFGRVGKILSNYFKAFGSKVNVFDVDTEKLKSAVSEFPEIKIKKSIDELIIDSEIIILSASYESQVIIHKSQLELLKNKFFINTARGELIDEMELLKCISNNYFKGIALDVISNEQGENNFQKFLELTSTCNFILTPHIAGATYSSMWKTENRITEKLANFVYKK